MTINGNARIVRVEEGNEPRHFLSLLKGKMVIFDGKKTDERKEITLFQIRGSNHSDMRTMECYISSYLLYSSDIFLLKCKEEIYIWFGKMASTTMRNAAPLICKLISPELKVIPIEEGSEVQEFWDKIGGKKTTYNTKILKKLKQGNV
jgi:hypothetical protein